jgi:hypothetical protein
MKFLMKATVALAAMSMVTAPVAASAAQPRFQDLRVDSKLENGKFGQTDDGIGAGTYVVGALALAAVIAGAIIAFDGSKRTPTSP